MESSAPSEVNEIEAPIRAKRHGQDVSPPCSAQMGFSLKRFWAYWSGTIVSPATTLPQVATTATATQKTLAYSTLAYFLFALLYGVLALLIYLRGGAPNWQPWVIIIPKENYYLWESLFMIPFSMITWVLFAALAHLFSKLLHGVGSFEMTLAVFGFTYSVPLLVLFWLPDFLQFLVRDHDFLGWLTAVYGTGASVWMALLSVLGLKVAQGLSWPRATLATLPAMAATVAVAMMLIR